MFLIILMKVHAAVSVVLPTFMNTRQLFGTSPPLAFVFNRYTTTRISVYTCISIHYVKSILTMLF